MRREVIRDGYAYDVADEHGRVSAQIYRPDRTSENHKTEWALCFATCSGSYSGLTGKYSTHKTLDAAERAINDHICGAVLPR